jgi:hypothetical protein
MQFKPAGNAQFRPYLSCIPQQEFIMPLSQAAAKARAEATSKRKEEQARDGAKAWVEYEAKSRAVAKNMERLRALRLAKEAAKPDAAKNRGRTVASRRSP